MAAQSLLALRVEYLVEPRFPGGHWAVLLNPAEQKVPNKIREYDDSIVLDHDLWLPLHPLLRQVKAGKPTERVWHFNYSQYYHRFRAVCQREGLNLVPFQTRHSAPSEDYDLKKRSLPDIKRRFGGWKSDKSVGGVSR